MLPRLLTVLLVAVLVVPATPAPGAEPPAASVGTSDEAVLRDFKQRLWPQAYANRDAALLDTLLAEEFVAVDPEGQSSTKAEELEYLRTTTVRYESSTYEILRLKVYGDTAVISGRGVTRGTGKNGPFASGYFSTNVFVRRDGRWQAVASHLSGVKPL